VKAFAADANRFKAALLKEIPEKADQAAVWMRIYGTSNGSWSQLEYVEQLASEQLGAFEPKVLENAAEKALLGKDRQLRRGAARLWQSWRSPLAEWKPAKSAELHRIVVQIQQEARYYPLRMEALDHLAAWNKDFSPDELGRCLAAGLHDPEPQVRRKAMLVAGGLRHAPSVADLMSVLEGSQLKVANLPEVPPWESRDVPDGFGDIAEGCSDAEVAALALADMQHAAARSVIESKKPQTAMYEVALALLGEGERLKPAYFSTEGKNQELQLAAVKAVIRSKGRYGLKMALDYQQATHWWEEEHVAQGLSQMLIAEKAPGSDKLKDCKSLMMLKEWFGKHGQSI
jgi:hypothetical protein